MDYELRSHQLQTLKSQWQNSPAALIKELSSQWDDSRLKLFLTFRGLAARKEFAAVFAEGEYVPLEVTGTHADKVIAFARQKGNECVVAIAPRFFSELGDSHSLPCGTQAWGDTKVTLPKAATWTNWLSNTPVTEADSTLIGNFCAALPIALLVKTRK